MADESESPTRKPRRFGRKPLIAVALVAVAALYFSGRMDTMLVHVGLNYTNCIQNGFGATYCGADAKAYQQQVKQIQDSVTQTSDAQVTEPAPYEPPGYTPFDAETAYRFLNNSTFTCGDLADNGCWMVVVMAKHGCPGGLFVTVNEMKGGTVVGDTIADLSHVPARTPARLELDATQAGVQSGDVQIQCT